MNGRNLPKNGLLLLLIGIVSLPNCARGVDYFVSTTGVDTNLGTSVSTPLRTIQKAMNKATAGSTVYIRGGTYRERVDVVVGGGSSTAPVVVQPYNSEVVTIKGSTVVTATWSRPDPVNKPNVWAISWPATTQQVFVDFETNPGPPLQQIGRPSQYTTFHYPNQVGSGLNDMIAGSFYWSSGTLYVWLADNSSPNLHTIEVSDKARLFWMGKDYIHLKNLKFRHTNVTGEQGTAVELANHGRIENCDIQWCSFGGVQMGYNKVNGVAIDCNASNNGAIGFQASGAKGFLIQNCTMNHNNYRGFNPQWHAGGFKGAADCDGIIDNCEVGWNSATGIWHDYSDTPVVKVIRNNYIHDNRPNEAGIMVEGSVNVLVYNNVLANNVARRGIYISASDGTKVYNNTIVGHVGSTGAGAVIDVDGMPRGTKTLKNNHVINNIIYNTSAGVRDVLIRVNEDQDGDGDLDIEGNFMNHNCVYRSSGSIKMTYRRLTPAASAITKDCFSMTDWKSNVSQFGWDANSLGSNPDFLNGVGEDYALSALSPAIDKGLNLPEVTEDYLGTDRPAGISTDIGAYESAGGGGGGAGSPITHQVESLAAGVSTGDTVTNTNDAGAGIELLNANAIGDFIAYTVPSVPAGTYNVVVRCKRYTDRGIFQLMIDGVNQGPQQNLYSSTAAYVELNLGPKSFTSGNKLFRFQVAGAGGGGGYRLAFDYIRLDPMASPVTHQVESLVSANSAGDTVQTTTDAGNAIEIFSANATGDFISYTVPITTAGTYTVIVRAKRYTDRGQFQLLIDNGNQGSIQNLYSATAAYVELNLGQRTFTTGNKEFKFVVMAAGTGGGYKLVFDYIRLEP